MKMLLITVLLISTLSSAMAREIQCMGAGQKLDELFILKVVKSANKAEQIIEIYNSDELGNVKSTYAKGIIQGKLLPYEMCNADLVLTNGSLVEAKIQRGADAFKGMIGLKTSRMEVFFTNCGML